MYFNCTFQSGHNDGKIKKLSASHTLVIYLIIFNNIYLIILLPCDMQRPVTLRSTTSVEQRKMKFRRKQNVILNK